MKQILLIGTALANFAFPAFAQAQSTVDAPTPVAQKYPESGIGDIIVTAQKRSQTINTVGMSITAASGDMLLQKGITNTADLVKAVPGFAFTQSPYSTPVYTLRGVGLYDYGLGSSPSVAVYVDEVSLPFPSMGVGATLDLERVEVLKGPQGTLFGQSSTGGAVNYIAAKPTDTLEAGGSITYERFGKVDVTGYVSGPISDTLNARLSGRVVEGGDWQKSITRPDDRAGAQRLFVGRLLLDWKPTDRLTVHFNANGNRDGGDTLLPQLQLVQPNIVAAPDSRNPFAIVDPVAFAVLTNPASSGYDASFLGRQNAIFDRAASGEAQSIGVLGAPTITGDNARLADWNPAHPHRRFDHFYQFSLRGDYEITDDVTLTSVTAYAYQKVNRYTAFDGTAVGAVDNQLFGNIKSFNQELRLSGTSGPLTWLAGANYDSAVTDDTVVFNVFYGSLSEPIPGLRYGLVNTNLKQKIKTYSGFGNAEYKVTDQLTLQAGIRYTKIDHVGDECASDPSSDQTLSQIFTIFTGVPIGPNQCYPFNDSVAVTDPGYFKPLLTPFRVNLPEDNVSWRAGLTYKFDRGPLLYANVSTGYKAGIISGFAPALTSQYSPAKQEKLVAYEAGFKAPLFDRRVQLNGSVFYYDYSDKQLRARVRDDTFGLLEKTVNVPKSRIWGLEGEIVAQPMEGLNLSLSGTYLSTKVSDTFAASSDGKAIYNQSGFTGDFEGSRLPFSPEFSGVADVEYAMPVGALKASVGGTVTYHSSTNATFTTPVLPGDEYRMPAYALVDLRAGLGQPDDAWRLSLFIHNATNKLYVNTIFSGTDSRFRLVGMPITYGATLSFKMR